MENKQKENTEQGLEMTELLNALSLLNQTFENIDDVVALEGKQGAKPENGVDYNTPQDIAKMILAGSGKDGSKGLTGATGSKGKDGSEGKDGSAISLKAFKTKLKQSNLQMSDIQSLSATVDDLYMAVSNAVADTQNLSDINKKQFKNIENLRAVFNKTMSGIAGEQNVQSDWNQATISANDFIKNKPVISTDYASTAQGVLADSAEQPVNKDTANGYAGLDGSSKINPSQLPVLAISETFVAANEAAQLALTVQEGDVAVRTDESKSYIALNDTNAAMTDWQELLTPSSAVTSVYGRTAAVTAQSGDYTTAQVTEVVDGRYMTDSQETNLDAQSGTNTGDEVSASTTVVGVVELATDAEMTTGTSTVLAITPANAKVELDKKALSGANSDITSITGLTTDLTVAQGGTGAGTFAANGIMYGNGTGAVGSTAVGTATHVLTSNGTGVAPTFQAAAGGGGAADYILLQDQKSSGTNGGASSAGSWITRVLNTEVADTGGDCSLSSNQFTLQSGTYTFNASAPNSDFASFTLATKLRLYNVSDSAVVSYGSNTHSGINTASNYENVYPVIQGGFVIASTKTFALQYRTSNAHSTYGLGVAFGFGVTEIYASILLTKIA